MLNQNQTRMQKAVRPGLGNGDQTARFVQHSYPVVSAFNHSEG